MSANTTIDDCAGLKVASPAVATATVFARDLQSLSLFRIVFAIFLIGGFYLLELPYFGDFRGEAGLLPAALLRDDFLGFGPITAILQALEAAGIQAILPWLFPAAALAFAVGYRTRCANAILLVLTAYIGFRNPYVLSGAEVLTRLLLLWGLFLPLDRYWSFDAALDPRPRDRPHPLIPFLAMRLQIASLYVFAGLFKLATPAWTSGVALAWSLQDNVFGGRDTGVFLAANAPYLLYALNYLVVAFQLAFPLLVYSPWRNDVTRGVAIGAAAAMHFSFIFCLNIDGFPYVCLTMLLLLVPDAWVTHLRRARLVRVAIFYEPGCAFCHKVSLLLREFMLAANSTVQPASADATANDLLIRHRSWVVRGDDGAPYLKAAAMAYLLRQNPLFAPLGWFCSRRALQPWFDRLYDLIGSHRRGLGRVAAFILPFRSPSAPGKAAQAVCGLLAAIALAINLASLEPLAIGHPLEDTPARFANRTPPWLGVLASDLLVWQNWPLFTPPPHWRRDYQVVAYDLRGDSFDVVARQAAPIYRVASNGRIVFANNRWLKYFSQLDILRDGDWTALGRYLCRIAQREATGSPVRSIAFSASTRPIAGTPYAGMPPDQNRSFDCRGTVDQSPAPLASKTRQRSGAKAVASAIREVTVATAASTARSARETGRPASRSLRSAARPSPRRR
jgi:hypothetical protein